MDLAEFASWCETQPTDAQYDYLDPCGCAIAQYFKHMGKDYEVAGAFGDRPETKAERAALAEPQTFGALAERLRSAIAA